MIVQTPSRSTFLTTAILLLANCANFANSADPRKISFDPVTFCHEKARGAAEEFCGGAEFSDRGEVTANTVSLVATRDAEDEASKACKRHFDAAKLNGVKDDDASVQELAEKDAKAKAQEFCQRVT